ncbi:MAG: hypothetical protein OEQ25_07445 [Gammaproteobacteria bacterium]|nr:hypothetical protein [Gammaproteobacteria bacterium]MDH3506961.1 hypothetical protein [Gammaproteobacteria bacterium]
MNAASMLVGVFAGAMVVISGALYALFLAFARLRASRMLARLSVASYLVLVVCALLLTGALALSPIWYVVIAVMLAGYWLAPRAIWHLTEATHAAEDG